MADYKVLNKIMVSGKALTHNYRYFASLNPQAKVCPVLKANAYGHGLTQIAEFVDNQLDAPFICVDSLYEAYELYKKKIKTPIFIMGYTDPNNYKVWKKLPFTFGIGDTESLLSLNQHQPGARVHIKLDTGMCRLGIREEEVANFIKVLKTCKNLKVEGIFSHLSQADDSRKSTFTANQVKLFKKMVKEFERAGFEFKYKHIQATAGAVILNDPYFNLVRLGIGFYGYSPFSSHSKEGRVLKENLKIALTLTSRIALIKEIGIGDEVGYGGTYRAKQNERIAILGIGYHDGVSRGLSNKVQFELNGTPCPSVGNICMNMTTVKLPRTVEVQIGDEMTLISPNIDSTCSVYRLANILDTIPYTILTNLHPSTRRLVV